MSRTRSHRTWLTCVLLPSGLVLAGAGVAWGWGQHLLALVAMVLLATVLLFAPKMGPAVWLLAVTMVPYWMSPLVLGALITPALAIGLLLLIASRGGLPGGIHKIDVVVAAFLILIGLTGVLGWSTRTAVIGVILRWGAPYVVGRTVLARWNLETQKTFIVILLAVGGFAVLELLANWHFFVETFDPSVKFLRSWDELLVRGNIVRSEWSFGHPIALGASLALAVPIVGRILRGRAQAFAMILLLAGLLSTASRGAVLAAFAGVGLCVWLGFASEDRRAPRRRAWAAFAGAVLLALVAVPFVTDTSESASAELHGTSNYRVNLLDDTLPIIRPLGLAEGAKASKTQNTAFGEYTSVDNGVLNIALNFGAIPALLFLALIARHLGRTLLGRAGPWEMAIACQLPVLLTVAMITQYQELFWAVEGLAVAEIACARARSLSNNRLDGAFEVCAPSAASGRVTGPALAGTGGRSG